MAEPRSDSSFYPKNHFLKVSGGYLNFKLISSAKEVWVSDASQVFENPIQTKYFMATPHKILVKIMINAQKFYPAILVCMGGG